MCGIFITFEGPDGSGKTTQVEMFAQWLQLRGKQVVCTREPGGTQISEDIRRILLDPSNIKMVDRTEALLYAAARAQHVEELIKPSLKEGKIVLCDRFTDSTLAYQGYGRGIDLSFLNQLNVMAVDGIKPDITFILDISPEAGFKRIADKRIKTSGVGKDRIELENRDFHEKVREGFRLLALSDGDRYKIINADRDKQTVHSEIIQIASEVLRI